MVPIDGQTSTSIIIRALSAPQYLEPVPASASAPKIGVRSN